MILFTCGILKNQTSEKTEYSGNQEMMSQGGGGKTDSV